MSSSGLSTTIRLLLTAFLGCGVLATGGLVYAQDSLLPPDALTPASEESSVISPDPVVPLEAVSPDSPVAEPTVQELASPGQESLPEQEVSEIPALPITEDPGENLFFDADSLVPAGEMGKKGGPQKVNPALQPASKLIVVKKNYSADSRQAQLVSAERAVKLGRYDSAVEMYNELYAKNKRDPNILLGRATALQHMGQTEAAIQAYDELLSIRPDNMEAQINMLGLMAQKYPAVALQRLMELREKNHQSVGIAAQIAVVQAETGHYDDALKYLGMAASMEPNNAGHIFNMAVIADKAGAKKEAIQYYERALELDAVYGGSRSIPREAAFERLAQLR